jgi:hypothetical protein
MQCNALSPEYGNQQNNSLPLENPKISTSVKHHIKTLSKLGNERVWT